MNLAIGRDETKSYVGYAQLLKTLCLAIANKYLYHAAVESSEMMNIYTGMSSPTHRATQRCCDRTGSKPSTLTSVINSLSSAISLRDRREILEIASHRQFLPPIAGTCAFR